MTDDFVKLCQCWDLGEAQALRASLEARGVAAFIDGEHQRGMMGLFGAGVALNLMVRGSQIELARELAADLIPDLAPNPRDQDAQTGEAWSPARRPQPEDVGANGEEEDDVADDDLDLDPDLADIPRKKSLAIPTVLAMLGLAVGTIHMYAGREKFGAVLLTIAAIGFGIRFSGQLLGAQLLIGVWAIDIIHGLYLLRRHNRDVDKRIAAQRQLALQQRAARLN